VCFELQNYSVRFFPHYFLEARYLRYYELEKPQQFTFSATEASNEPIPELS